MNAPKDFVKLTPALLLSRCVLAAYAKFTLMEVKGKSFARTELSFSHLHNSAKNWGCRRVCLVSRNAPTRDLVKPSVSEQMRVKCFGITLCLDLLGPKCHCRKTLSTSRSVVSVLLESNSAAARFAFVRSLRRVMPLDVQTQMRVALMKNRDHVVAETCVALEVLKQQSPRSIW